MPERGRAETVQGELLRVQTNLSREYLLNGMMSYYLACDEPQPDSYVEQLDFLLETLLPFDPEYLGAARAAILEERRNHVEIAELEEKRDAQGLSAPEAARLEALGGFRDWERLFERTALLAFDACRKVVRAVRPS